MHLSLITKSYLIRQYLPKLRSLESALTKERVLISYYLRPLPLSERLPLELWACVILMFS